MESTIFALLLVVVHTPLNGGTPPLVLDDNLSESNKQREFLGLETIGKLGGGTIVIPLLNSVVHSNQTSTDDQKVYSKSNYYLAM